MPGASRSIVINAPPEKVFDVVCDYERYPQFLPECKEVKVTGRQGTAKVVQYKVELIKTIRYTIKIDEQRPSAIRWTFVEGEFMKDNRGSWTLEPEGDGKTKATYNIEMTLGPLVPKTLVNTLVGSSLPKMLEAFKSRVEAS